MNYCKKNCENQYAHNCHLPPPSPEPEEQTPAKRPKSTEPILPLVAQSIAKAKLLFYRRYFFQRCLSTTDELCKEVLDQIVSDAVVSNSFDFDKLVE